MEKGGHALMRQRATPTVLSNRSIGKIAATTAVPGYDRQACSTGIVHLGPGAFHRAHQAVYIDNVLAQGETSWALCGVSLRSSQVRDSLMAQNNLYTLAILDEQVQFRVIGAIRELLTASQQAPVVIERLSAATTRVVTLTITEKGYCLTPAGDLDVAHPDIQQDLARPEAPVSAVGFIVEGLRRRRQAGITSFSVLSCDNLADNGRRMAHAVQQYASLLDPALARWIDSETCFPNSMVDSITPATDDALRPRVEWATGLADAWPVQREAFSQWVVEDQFSCGRPSWQNAGVTMTSDVAPFEQAKLRLLNGAHSTMAYLGTLYGYATINDVVADKEFMQHVKLLMHEEISPSLGDMPFDINGYIDSILSRFANPAIAHQLSQIAWDGSQKLPFRILDTVRDNLLAGQGIERLCFTIAAWFHFIRHRVHNEVGIVDPLAGVLAEAGHGCTGNAASDVARFSLLETVFDAALYSEPRFHRSLCAAYEKIETRGAAGAVKYLLSRPQK